MIQTLKNDSNLKNYKSLNTLSVKESYDKIATEFAVTRVFTWKWTDDFIDKLRENSVVLDIGSGNGRNLIYTRVNILGLDISFEQLKMDNKLNSQNIQGDMIKLPFRNESFDSIISIASFHHLNNDKDRIQCLYEMYRILIPNGRILLSIWSINQPIKTRRKFDKCGDTIVYWKDIPRYYYIFQINEIKELLLKFFIIESHKWDCGNEIFIIKKI